MRAVGAVITLICGIAVLLGALLPWLSESVMSVPPFGSNIISLSAWDIIVNNTSWWYRAELMIPDKTQALLVFIGGVVMLVCAFPSIIIVSGPGKPVRSAVITLGIVASLAAFAAFVGSVCSIVKVMDTVLADYMSYGLYMAAVAALVGLIFGTIMTSKA